MEPHAALLGNGDPASYGNRSNQLAGNLGFAADIGRSGAVDDGRVGFRCGAARGAVIVQDNILQADPALETVLIDTAPAVIHFINGDLGSVGQGTDLIVDRNLGLLTDIQVDAAGNRTGSSRGTAGGAAAQTCQRDIGKIYIQLIQRGGEAILGKVRLLDDAPLQVLAVGILNMGFVEGDRSTLRQRANLSGAGGSSCTNLDALIADNLTGVNHFTCFFHRQGACAYNLHQGNGVGGSADPLILIGLDLHPAVGLLLVDIDSGIVRQGVELGAVGAGAQANLHGNAAADGAHIHEAGVSGSGRNAAGVQLNAGSLHEEGARSQPGVRILFSLLSQR